MLRSVVMAALLFAATAAWADLRVPDPVKRPTPGPGTKTVSFEVMVATSGGSDTPTLIIPLTRQAASSCRPE